MLVISTCIAIYYVMALCISTYTVKAIEIAYMWLIVDK